MEDGSTKVSRKILLLPLRVIHGIAAGEVIDRPAAVVRELVDNALDAGATRIDVDIEDGGRNLIRVSDDGSGMSEKEVPVALQRHATSKLRSIDDLLRLSTLGFRGEGLSSIAAVSRLLIATRQSRSIGGIQVQAEEGCIESSTPIGCAAGTSIEVRNLFFNLPARRSLLKSAAVESALIADVLERYAFSFFEKGFSLSIGGKQTLSFAPGATRRQRALALLRLAPGELESFDRAVDEISIQLHIAHFARTLRNSSGLRFFVNRRPIRDSAMLKSMLLSLDGRLEKGRYPVGGVFVELDQGQVDINVHPQKREVRFARPSVVFGALLKSTRALLSKKSSVLSAGPADTAGGAGNHSGSIAKRRRVYLMISDRRESESGRGSSAYLIRRERLWEAARCFWGHGNPRNLAPSGSRSAKDLEIQLDDRPSRIEPTTAVPPPILLGRTTGGLLIVERNEEILIIEEESATREIWRLRLERAFSSLPVANKELPTAIPLEAAVTKRIAGCRESLARVGFEIDELSEDFLSLRKVPRIFSEEHLGLHFGALGNLLSRIAELPHGALEDEIAAIAASTLIHPRLAVGEILASLDLLGPPRELRIDPRLGRRSSTWRLRLQPGGKP